ncbi:hypothetical protein EYC80_004704 [Monilinia laxa]|uniref:Heterokaryon incompatibility domain-containing protein n=1 Tax=Monilinia laxa TaxID=61186 RepID=A0A5N6KI29_MONLA|nr:hypothetical protein EYC80_004704 [Monilinia laxa]
MLEMSAVNAMKYSQIFTDDGTHASWKIPDRRRVLKPTLDYCVDLTRKWMEISSSQTDKSINHRRDLPKRVIDVSGPTILLRDFSAVPLGHPSRQGLYIALSHRWGPPETMLRTLKSTITMMMIGIDTKRLSLGFQDAIKLTKLLGLDYIWIDCLCIVQDSKEDWDEESSKMNSYYGLSWLTIALGTESSLGCIPKRQGDSKDIYQIVTNNNDILYLQDGDSEPRDSRSRLSNSILYDRGWTYQEEILAPRYLSFLDEQIVFRCGSYLLSEDGCHTQSMLLGIPTGELNTFENTSYSWSQIVTNYSPRKLTMAEDKLPALSGIAREFYKIAPSKYLAGLWQEEFLSQLLWSTVRRNVKPTKYRAPSWSWASIDGSVISGSSRLAGTFVLEVQHVSTELEGSDPMGRVKGGSLTARGFIRTGMITNSIPNQRHTSISHFLRISPYGWEPEKVDHYQTFVNFDISGEAAYKAEKSVVHFLNVTEKGSLILLPVPKTHPNWKENTYERIGISHWQKKPKLWEVVDEEVERTRSAAEVLRLRALSRLEVVHII